MPGLFASIGVREHEWRKQLKRSTTGGKAGKGKPKRQGTEHDFTTVARRVVEQAIGEGWGVSM